MTSHNFDWLNMHRTCCTARSRDVAIPWAAGVSLSLLCSRSFALYLVIPDAKYLVVTLLSLSALLLSRTHAFASIHCLSVKCTINSGSGRTWAITVASLRTRFIDSHIRSYENKALSNFARSDIVKKKRKKHVILSTLIDWRSHRVLKKYRFV